MKREGREKKKGDDEAGGGGDLDPYCFYLDWMF